MAKRKVQPDGQEENQEIEIVSDEPMQRVTFALPRSVLIALLDVDNPLADAERALRLGLLQSGGQPSPLGKLIIAGTDETALRHKMNAAWRNAYNEDLKG